MHEVKGDHIFKVFNLPTEPIRKPCKLRYYPFPVQFQTNSLGTLVSFKTVIVFTGFFRIRETARYNVPFLRAFCDNSLCFSRPLVVCWR